MARPLRIELDGALYHVTARGIERRKIFREDADMKSFLDILQDAIERYNLFLHCYCLMPNHYHLMVETPRACLSRAMHDLDGTYTRRFNLKYRRVGHLFQGRYKAILVEKEMHLANLSRYIHANPVRAKLARRPEDYRWSSYRAYTGRAPLPSWLYRRGVLGDFARDMKLAGKAYKKYVEMSLGVREKNPLREAVEQTILGSEGFVERMKGKLEGRKCEGDIPALRRLMRSWTTAEVIEAVARTAGVSEEEIRSKRTRRAERMVAMCLARRYTRETKREIGRRFGVGGSAVGNMVSRFEEREKSDRKLRELAARVTRRLEKSTVLEGEKCHVQA